MIKAVILDMDGLMIDSEPLWREVEKKVFATVGVELTDELMLETMGLRVDEVVKHRYSKQAWTGKSHERVVEEILDQMVEIIGEKGMPMPGLNGLLDLFESLNMPLGLASSSPERIIDAALDNLGIRSRLEVTCSAQHEPFGKPHPGIYLTAAEKLDVEPVNCLAFEDSLNGLLAAKAARMKAVAVPDEENRHDPRFVIADLKLNSLLDFTADTFHSLA